MNRNSLGNPVLRQRQQGAVLIVALVLLLVLTVLGTAGIQDTIITERMAGNQRDLALSFETAELELRRWEKRMDEAPVVFSATVHGYEVTDVTISVDPDDNTNYADSTVSTSELSTYVDTLPRYFLERLPEIPLPDSSIVQGFQEKPPVLQYYRVTAKGFGVTPSTESILQSTFLPPF